MIKVPCDLIMTKIVPTILLVLLDVEFQFQATMLFTETFCNVKSSNCNGLDGEF